MPGRIESLPPMKLAFFRNVGPYGPALKDLWQKLGDWRRRHEMFGPDVVTLGISHDDPCTTPPEQCRYDAGVIVPSDFKSDGDIGVADRPAMNVFVMPFEGDATTIGDGFGRAFAEMLAAGHRPGDEPCFERYASDPMVAGKPGVFRCDICLPVRNG